MTALRASWRGIVDAYGELFSVVGMNVIWFLITTPLALVGSLVVSLGATTMNATPDEIVLVQWIGFLLLGIFLMIGPNPAAVGIHYWANHLVKEQRLEFSLYWEGLRTHLWPALRLFLFSALVLTLLVTNAVFYVRTDSTPLRIFGIVWAYATYVWLSMQPYMLPLLIEQENKRVRLVLRNAFFLALANVITSFVLFVVCTLLALLSIGIPLLVALLAGSVIALIQARTLQALLEIVREIQAKSGRTPAA